MQKIIPHLFQASKDDPDAIVISGWGQYPAHPVGWQGMFYFEHPVLMDKEVEGVYVYPDWTSCIQVNKCIFKFKYSCQSRSFNRVPGTTTSLRRGNTAPSVRYFRNVNK